MPTLNYVSKPPRAQVIDRARSHLLVWLILFFFVAFAIAAYGTASGLASARQYRGTELL